MKPIIFSTPMVRAILQGNKTQTRRVIRGGYMHQYTPYQYTAENSKHYAIPYHRGDVLWVRETWRKTGVISKPYAYKADEETLNLIGENGELLSAQYRWKPSIHMTKEAVRIFLKVTDVRVERLQDITKDDCIAEGVVTQKELNNLDTIGNAPREEYARYLFRELWDTINAKRNNGVYSWERNPFVWVITFERS